MIPGVNMGILQWSCVFLEEYLVYSEKHLTPKNTLQNVNPLNIKTLNSN